MINIASFLASSYSSTYPLINTAQAVCSINGVSVPCSNFELPGSFFILVGLFMVIFLLLIILMIASTWRIYDKAGKPGWASIIPIYNLIILLEIVDKPEWWVILYFIPGVNIVISIIVIHNLSKKFGEGVGFTLGLIFLSFIFYPLLAFGKYSYIKLVVDESLPISNLPQTPSGTIS